MPDFALDLGFDRIRLLLRRSVDWEFVGDVETASPELTPQLRALILSANPDPDTPLPARVFLPEDQVLFDRIPLGEDEQPDISRLVARHLDGRTPYDLSQLRADWDPHLDVVDIAAVAEETMEEASRFAAAHGIDPVAITVRIDPAVFPRHPEFRELPTNAIFSSVRHAAPVETEVIAPATAKARGPAPQVPIVPVAIAASVAAVVAVAALFLTGGEATDPAPELEIAEAEPIDRPALVDDLSAVAMPQADLGLAPLPDASARAPDLPPGEQLASVAPSDTAPRAQAADPGQASFSAPDQTLAAPNATQDTELPRPSAIALSDPGILTVPSIDTGSATRSFPLKSDTVQSEVTEAPGVGQLDLELDLASIPREFIMPPGQWPESETFAATPSTPEEFAPDAAPTAVAPALAAPAAGAPAAEITIPTAPTRAENDAIDGPDELAPALAPPSIPVEAELALLTPLADTPSFAPQEKTLRPSARPEPPTEEELAARLIVTAVETSLVPRDRPAPRRPQAVAVAAASTAAVPQRQTTTTRTAPAPEPAAAAPARRQVQPGTPQAGRVARAATQPNAIQFGRVNLLGVFGSDGARRALVRLSNGRMRRVKVGDRIDGGRVAAIGRSNLSYVKGGRTIQLAIPSG